jgi:hypothetical protein
MLLYELITSQFFLFALPFKQPPYIQHSE